jgi:hypothetical protein
MCCSPRAASIPSAWKSSCGAATLASARRICESALVQLVLDVVPSQEQLSHNHVEDGRREITLYVYADPEIEREHDTEFGPRGGGFETPS